MAGPHTTDGHGDGEDQGMSGTEQVTDTSGLAGTAFARELRLRLVAARESLERAEAADDELLAQIAEADLGDLRALAARNDVEVDAA